MSDHFLLHLGIALLAAFVGGLVARLFRLPVLIGYLIAGVIVGPNTPGIVADKEAVGAVAELGVVMLMFAVGVHFSLQELRAQWRTAVFGGVLQIAGTVVLGVLLGLLLGWGVYAGLFLGCALALSSTAVMLKILEERGEQGTAHGRAMLGILVIQDFSLILMIVVLPSLALFATQGIGALAGIGIALLKAVAFLGIVLLLAIRGVPALLRWVARTGSRELFLLLAVCLCLVTGVAANYAGMGLELGAFLAGVVISETDYAHEVFAQIRPLRDVFASLFFVSVGMLLNPKFLFQHGSTVALVVFTILLGKSLVAFFAVYSQKTHGRTALFAGLGLAQIGEFSFVLATVGSARKLIPAEIASVILSAALITLLLAPFVFGAAAPLYQWLNRLPHFSAFLNRQMDTLPDASKSDSPEKENGGDVLVVGYGRVGRYVSEALRAQGIPHTIMDYNLRALDGLENEGVVVIYGDASSSTVLEQAALADKKLAILALPEADTLEMTIRILKRHAPHLAVVARVHRGIDIPRMRDAGADAVVHAEFEAGTEMIRQSLDRLFVDDGEIRRYLDEVRQHRYRQAEG